MSYSPVGNGRGRVPSSPLTSNPSTRLLAPEPFSAPPAPRAQHLLPQHTQNNPFHDPKRSGPPSTASSVGGSSFSGKFSLDANPSFWGTTNEAEDDDWLHDPRRGKSINSTGSIFTGRGCANVGCLVILALGLTTLFAGYPLIDYFTKQKQSFLGGFNLGGINATGQIMETAFALVDKDTPPEAMTYRSIEDDTDWQLVFSDEFNVDGRSFYPGDDPFWEAVDMHYWGTNNLEWYDPGQLTTEGGNLVISLEERRNHDLDYMGGMMMTWNKFCFTGGILLSRIVLPGNSDIYGLWPALWTMGNLGRAGYGATADGMWPYSYEACDVGTLQNQTLNGQPRIALTSGPDYTKGTLSYLPGQRLSACTCPDEPHPGPRNRDGTYVGRSAPEIDVMEAQVSLEGIGHVSQSAQWAPFDPFYSWDNVTYMTIYDEENVELNSYQGGPYQQTTSGIGITDQRCYEFSGGCFSEYGFEYKEGYEEDGGYITWIRDGQRAWRFGAGGLGANEAGQISARPVPKEPMYLILNLGISENFGLVDFENLRFPTTMLVDWVRVYQHPDRINVGCDPTNFPTSNYINTYIEAYTNPNLTTWEDDYKQPWPRNRLIDEC